MKYLKEFYDIFPSDESKLLYNVDLNKILPDELTIREYGVHTFKRGNIMKHSDMFQITYVNVKNEWGYTDTLEIDIYTVQDVLEKNIRFNIDITIGDFVVSEFTIEAPNKVKVIQNMTYGTKFCQDCPIFSFTDESIKKMVDFFNHFKNIKLSTWDLRFLDERNNWRQNK